MKAILLFTAFLALAASSLDAQVIVEVRLEQNQFLRNETLPVKIRVTNRSGLPLKIGESNDWLTFSVMDRDNKVVPQVQDLVVGGKFELPSSESITKTIDISPAYDFSQPGKYRVTAVAQFPQLNLSVGSDPQAFDVVRGAQVWAQVCGVPVPGGAAPHYMRYSLLQAFYVQQLRLYVRVADEPEEHFARVVPLGNVVSFAKPEQFIDRSSELHVLFQSGPRSYEYRKLNPLGEVVLNKGYELGTVRPRLKIFEDGRVEVVGGAPRKLPTVAAGPIAGTNGTNVIRPPN